MPVTCPLPAGLLSMPCRFDSSISLIVLVTRSSRARFWIFVTERSTTSRAKFWLFFVVSVEDWL